MDKEEIIDLNEIALNIDLVVSEYFEEVVKTANSTGDIYSILWDIYESECNANPDRDGQIFDDMVKDYIEKFG